MATPETPATAVEIKETAPEVVEYWCLDCMNRNLTADLEVGHYPKVDVTFELLTPIDDEQGVTWAVLCSAPVPPGGIKKEHMAEYKVTRHRILAEVPKVA